MPGGHQVQLSAVHVRQAESVGTKSRRAAPSRSSPARAVGNLGSTA